jgi:hypothetical protein
MGCCRQSRTAQITERHRMRVRYGGGRPVVVQGPVTGLSYHFSGIDRLQLVDPRDAVAILRNPLFRAEGLVEIATS